MKAKQINIGILAHVDAGKTTLAEALLYKSGSIRKAGRVDHGDAYLDTYELEKQRGITIFSKQAQLTMNGTAVTLLDTPGHVDFSAEMERTLQVLDYALLVVSGADGVQGHVLTLWRLLKQYKVPVFLFINKMDQPGTDREALMQELKSRLDEGCVCMQELFETDGTGEWKMEERLADMPDAFLEETAMLDEALMEGYLEGRQLTAGALLRLVSERKLFPCFFGSALKMQGIDVLMRGMAALMQYPVYPDAFGARVYKIGRSGHDRLTYLKLTGGELKARQTINGEKVNQIRIYSGQSAQMVQQARAGEVVAVTGLRGTFAGQGLGAEKGITKPVLSPVLSYALILPEGTDIHKAYLQLRELEEEIPELHISQGAHAADQESDLQETGGSIHVQVMGEVQMEILKNLVAERMGMDIGFDEGEVVYRETISDTFEGVGHFEPLRHYAEVHLILEPGERGSGLTFVAACPPDTLEANWQNLVMTHLMEKTYRGTLTGSPITDMKITLVSGRAHIKHTEGGDFREATYRAVRQGLMQALTAGACVLLEPCYSFSLEVPDRCVGRAMTDIQNMGGSFEGPETGDGMSRLTGTAPAAAMRSYQQEVTAYSGGEGRLSLRFEGYRPCDRQEQITLERGYDPEADMSEPAGSVFCSHGAGVYVPWEEVPDHMHLPAVLTDDGAYADETAAFEEEVSRARRRSSFIPADIQDDAELKEIFERTYGSIRQDRGSWNRSNRRRRADTEAAGGRSASGKAAPAKKPCLLVDGYNIIFAWPELSDLANTSLDSARTKLVEILANYQGYHAMTLIVVFDAYKVAGGMGEDYRYHNVYVVFTKEAETADAYIERTVHELAGRFDITVATSDGAEQAIIFGSGARRMAAKELYENVQMTVKEIREVYLKKNPGGKNYLFDQLDADLSVRMEKIRLGDAAETETEGSESV